MSIKINKSDSVTNRLSFKPFPMFNNLCMGYLVNVEVTTSEIKSDSNWEFKGKTVPRLAFHFEGWKDSKNAPDRYYGQSEMLIATTNKDGEPIIEIELEKRYRELWKRIKHLHDQYIGTANYKEMDFEVEFEPNDPIDKRIIDMSKFFNNVANAFNKAKGKKAVYEDKTLLAMKLIKTPRKTKTGKTYYVLALPNFVGKGCVQRVKVVDNKINTTLEFTGNETVDLTATVPVGAPIGTKDFNASDIPDEVASELGL